ncbi:hypothetical protein DSC45_34765 [Streptomyces sp. YIM 130001]|nr:hypothetical protein DSC45_34765 [Streptomyces sp. YIM 130001]
MKSAGSLARKVATRYQKNPNRSPQEHLNSMTDVVRYTIVSRNTDTVFSDAREMASSLRKLGWTMVEADHSYTEGATYKGLHFLARHPSGETVEIQAHSEQSMAVKDKNHIDYEVSRDLATPIADRVAANERMVARSATLRAPAGIQQAGELGGVPLEVKNR